LYSNIVEGQLISASRTILPRGEFLDEVSSVRFSVLEPLVLKQLLGGPPLLRFFLQTAVDEVLEVLGPTLVYPWCRIVANVVKHTDLLLVQVWWFTRRQLHNEYPERPHVHLVVVALFTFNHFGGHPAHRTHFARSIHVIFCQLSCIPKVS
jgi:hypothetical protein